MGVELTIQAYLEVAIGISRRYLQPTQAFRSEAKDEDGERDGEDGAPDEIWDLQAGHTSHVAGMVFARGIMEMDGVMVSKRAKFRGSSEAWHSVLGFESAIQGGRTGPKRRFPFAAEAEDARFAPLKRLRKADPGLGLRQIVGERVGFREVQEAAVGVVRACYSCCRRGAKRGEQRGGGTVDHVTAGHGKTGARPSGSDARNGTVGSPPTRAQVVLVTSESAVGDGFRTFLNHLKRRSN